MTTPQHGEVIADRYELLEALGHGGGGTVYRARQLGVAREVAVKLLADEQRHEAAALRRFEREARLISRLSHPNTVTVYEFDHTPDGALFIAMELVEGVTLKDELRDQMQLPPARAVRIITQVLKSLAEAHSYGIIHRDIKPANIMLCDMHGERDFVKVLDFGVATVLADASQPQHADDITQTMDVAGTPQYLAPEQLRGGALSAASDIYSLGSMMFEMLAGYNPFAGENLNDVIIKHLFDPLPPLPQNVQDYPALVAVVERMLAKDAEGRFQSAEEALHALGGWRQQRRQPATGRPSLSAISVISSDVQVSGEVTSDDDLELDDEDGEYIPLGQLTPSSTRANHGQSGLESNDNPAPASLESDVNERPPEPTTPTPLDQRSMLALDDEGAGPPAPVTAAPVWVWGVLAVAVVGAIVAVALILL